MIIVKLMGGLGNQMFQYALGRRLAHDIGCKLKLDVSNYSEYRDRSFQLHYFNIRAAVATKRELDIVFGRGLGGRLFSYVVKCAPSLCPEVIHEKGQRFDRSILISARRTYLSGFWQSEEYFRDIAEIIRGDFTLKEPPDPLNAGMLKKIQDCNAVAVHIRRGDYVADSHARTILGTMPTEYYRQAMERMAKQVQDPHFFVFSDDSPWVKCNFDLPFPMTIVDHNPTERAHLDLFLMSQCRHQIISNSTFGWWGAWLNISSDKIVLAPKVWFRDEDYDSRDVIPAGWVRI